MVRKLASTLATVGMLTSPLAFALGLGEAELLSSLNQPFKAKIQLAQTQGVSAEDIRVQLADERAFAKAGLNREFFLRGLNFSVRSGENGPYIELSSTTPVKEPFLNFLLEVEWPKGQLMREYTFLLDPPTYNSSSAQQVSKTAATANKAIKTSKAVKEGAHRIKVGPTDTLWSLARKNRPSSKVTIKQAMLAIQDANPDAFPTGNINNMEAGSTILIPSMSAMTQRSKTDAIREVARQNKSWVSFKARSVTAAPKATPKGATPKTTNSANTAPLKLVAEDSATTSDSAATASKELALSREKLDQSAREKQELTSRLNELQKQVSTLQKLVKLKDEQLAAMETMLAKQNQLLSGKNVSVEDADTRSPSDANDEAQLNEPPLASTASAAVTGKVGAGAIGLDLAAASQKQTEDASTMDSEPEVEPEPVKSFSLDKQESQELDPSSFLVDNLQKHAVVIGGAVAGIFGLILLVMMLRRRSKAIKESSKRTEDSSDNSDLAAGAITGAAGLTALDSMADDGLDLDDSLDLDDDLDDNLDLNDDLDSSLDSDLDESSLSGSNDLDLGLDDLGLDDLSLDDLGEPDAVASASTGDVDDLGGFDLGDDTDLDDELSLDDLDFPEDFDLGDLDEDGETEAPFVQAELTNDAVSTKDADTGESVQDNLIDLELENIEAQGIAAEDVEPLTLDPETALESSRNAEVDVEPLISDTASDTALERSRNAEVDIEPPISESSEPALESSRSSVGNSDSADDSLELSDLDDEIIELEGDDLGSFDADDLDNSVLAGEDDSSDTVVNAIGNDIATSNLDAGDDDILAALADEIPAVDLPAVDLPDTLDLEDLDLGDNLNSNSSLGSDDILDLDSLNDMGELGDDVSADEQADLDQQADLEPSAAPEESSVIAEAESYRELGLFEQAAALLQGTLSDNPNDNDLRLKFMEVLVDLGDEATFDHELRQLQTVGDAKALTAAMALQQELYKKMTSNDSRLETGLDDLNDILDLNGEDQSVESNASIDLDLNSELDALERDFNRYAEKGESDDDLLDLDDIDFELTDLDLSDDISDDEPMINLNPVDLGEPETLDQGDFELTDLTAETDDLGDSLNDDIVDLSPHIDDSDDLADLGELSDISFDDPSEGSDDQLSLDDLLDENDDPAIKLDLARAYVDMGNTVSALEALKDVLNRGDADQKDTAKELIATLQRD
ncbi:FimV/HubP family polar landmark protein [Oceanospirillum maris]|uniref:FimV/HubP family polar landmark protein n=1 Tax=Oceanospirillum maris TaxID=64977 RepID=UPI00042A0AA8|nr:FimV/HubP family polar landmark protein [Oceanospirillum maris]